MQLLKRTPDQAHQALLTRLQDELNTKRVLWLVSGGSNVAVTAAITTELTAEQSTNLTIGLIDERYGPVGHPDSNWQALIAAGLDAKNAALLPVLIDNRDRKTTADTYNQTIVSAFNDHDIVIALLGIGQDGHTAGILPRSIATQDISRYVIDYTSDPFERITLSFAALLKINVAYVFAFGQNKVEQLSLLQDQDIDKVMQPAQIIRQIHEAYVYNEVKGE